MLVESFVASLRAADLPPVNSPHKDAGIFLHEYQPKPAIKSIFKKSSTPRNGLAICRSHVFAAQTDKATVNIYSIDRGNQEALVPFKEKITSLALVGDTDSAGILALGTEAGSVILWELHTGRQISTPAAHLQAIECMKADATRNFLLTGASDANVHVWSIPKLLSFNSPTELHDLGQSSLAPIHTLSSHRAPITSLVIGHSHTSANIAVSGSSDNTCKVWDYRQGDLLHTFLLTSTPLCLCLDPADRAAYAGYQDGSVQLVEFFDEQAIEQSKRDKRLAPTPSQPPDSSRWPAVSEHSPINCIDVSYDGTSLVTGHENGKVQQWDVGLGASRGVIVSDFHCPVTNLIMLKPEGFFHSQAPASKLTTVPKSVFDGSTNNGTDIPGDYLFRAHFTSSLPLPRFTTPGIHTQDAHKDPLMEDFEGALVHPSLPQDLIEEGLQVIYKPQEPAGDITILKGWRTDPRQDVIQAQLEVSEARAATFKYIELANDMGKEVLRMQDAERARRRNKRMKRVRREKYQEAQRKKTMGETAAAGSDQDMLDEAGEDSTSTDEMSSSD